MLLLFPLLNKLQFNSSVTKLILWLVTHIIITTHKINYNLHPIIPAMLIHPKSVPITPRLCQHNWDKPTLHALTSGL